MADQNSSSDKLDKLDEATELFTEFIAPSIPAKTRGIIYVAAASIAGACGAATAALVPLAVGSDNTTLAIIASVVGVVGGISGAVTGALAKSNVTPDPTPAPVTTTAAKGGTSK